MEEKLLTVREVAGLKGCGERNVRLLIENGKLIAEAIKLDVQGPGRGGVQYRIPLSALDDKLQLKYKRLERRREKENASLMDVADGDAPEAYEPFNIEMLTAAEREEIAFWKEIIDEWHLYRETSGLCKEEADSAFIRLMNAKQNKTTLTRNTLYRKWRLFKESGAIALIDKRGKHGAHVKKLTSFIWDIFEAFYLDESRKSVSLCAMLTALELEALQRENKLHELPELPTITTFSREVKKIPLPYVEYFRYGRTRFIGKCSPYIKRMYDLEPNDIWVADNHTFDVMLYDGEKPVRLYLTAFMDVRTRKMMGWCVTDRPCSDATIFALKKGIERHGIPKMLYTDNGREFLFHDFGGNGFRRRKAQKSQGEDELKPPTILKELGIEFRTALPMNARAKGVERAFRTVKELFSKLFEAYTGGNILERPERLKHVVKTPEKLKRVEDFIGYVDTFIDGIYNKQPHSGEGMDGSSPDEMFEELLVEKRVATKEQLSVMFMRWSNVMKIGKNGLTLTFFGKKLQYFDKELWIQYFGREVYVRYNPEDLTEIKVYDTDERFICTAGLKEELPYDATADEIARNEKLNRSAVKAVSKYLVNKKVKNRDALSLMLDKAVENLELDAGEKGGKAGASVKVVRPIFGDLDKGNGGEVYAKAVGSDVDIEEFDWTAALDKVKNTRINGEGENI